MSIEDTVEQVFMSGGRTFVRHSSEGAVLYVCSTANDVLKIFNLSDPEQIPDSLDVLSDITSFEISLSEKAVITSKSGECGYYDLKNQKRLAILARSSLAFTDAAFTHGGSQVLCGGSDGDLRLISLDDPTSVKTINLNDKITSISYNNVGDLATVSLAGGDLIIYSYSSTEPSRLHTFKNLIVDKKSIEEDDDDIMDSMDFELDLDSAPTASKPQNSNNLKLSTTKPDWHPDGDLLAVPTRARDIQVYTRNNFDKMEYRFRGKYEHDKPIVALKWSPDGKHLASIGLDNKLIIWETKSQRSIKSFNLPKTPTSFSWGKMDSDEFQIIVGSDSGHTMKFDSIVAKERNAFVDDLALEDDDSGKEEQENENEVVSEKKIKPYNESEDEGDDVGISGAEDGDITGLFGDGEDDFIVDDDGQGYTQQKRPSPLSTEPATSKRLKVSFASPSSLSVSQYKLEPFSAGSTPWSGNRRYLTITPIGYAWTVTQDGYNTITISFFDRSLHREYHFRDFSQLDLASLNDEGVLLASSGKKNYKKGATIMYKSHDQRYGWERTIALQRHEFISTVSLGKQSVFVCTSSGFVRRYSLFGRLERIERMAPVVACISSEKYLFTITLTSSSSFSFNIQDLDGKYFQRNEYLPIQLISLNNKHPIKGLFFSSDGDPCIIGQDNYLLVLSRWRDPLQASWIPILDTSEGVKKIAAGDNVNCWPLGLFRDQFNFVVIRGSDYPSFPLALPGEMPIKLPVSAPKQKKKKNRDSGDLEDDKESDEEDNVSEEEDPEEELVRYITLGELLNDAISNDDVIDETAEERLTEISIKYDASILKQFGQSCNDSNLSDALYLADKLRDDRALAAAGKIAERLELTTLVSRINKIREARMEFD